MSELNGSGVEFDAACCKRGGSCACGGDVCGKDSRRATPPSPSTAEGERAALIAALKPFATAYEPQAAHDDPNERPEMRAFLDRNTITPSVTVGDFRRAHAVFRAALAANAADSEAKERDAARLEAIRVRVAEEALSFRKMPRDRFNAVVDNVLGAAMKATQKESVS